MIEIIRHQSARLWTVTFTCGECPSDYELEVTDTVFDMNLPERALSFALQSAREGHWRIVEQGVTCPACAERDP